MPDLSSGDTFYVQRGPGRVVPFSWAQLQALMGGTSAAPFAPGDTIALNDPVRGDRSILFSYLEEILSEDAEPGVFENDSIAYRLDSDLVTRSITVSDLLSVVSDSVNPRYFRITVQIANNGDSHTLGNVVNPSVSWGDGAETRGQVSHVYAVAGTYVIKLRSPKIIPSWSYNDSGVPVLSRSQLRIVDWVGNGIELTGGIDLRSTSITAFRQKELNVVSLDLAFSECTSLSEFSIEDRDLSTVQTIVRAFTQTGAIAINGYNFRGLTGGSETPFCRRFEVRPSGITSFGTLLLPNLMPTAQDFGMNDWFGTGNVPARGCQSLASFCIDTGARITTMNNAFYGNAALALFDVADRNLSKVQGIERCFSGTGAIAINGYNFRGLTGDSYYAFCEAESVVPSRITSFGTLLLPNLMPTAQDFGMNHWFGTGNVPARGCQSLASFCIDTGARITAMNNAFYGNAALALFDVADRNLSKVQGISRCFSGTGAIAINGYNFRGLTGDSYYAFCETISPVPSRITSFGTPLLPNLMPTAQDFSMTVWFAAPNNPARSCPNLTSFCIDTGERITSLHGAFFNTPLQDFRIINTATGLPRILDGTWAFANCALTPASIENILVCCDNGGQTGITLWLQGGTNAASGTWTSTANTAYANLISKGWSIARN